MFNSIKESIISLFKNRLVILIIFFCILSTILIHRVFVLQIVKGEDYLKNYTMSIERTVELTATRGNIYDRNGELLAGNRLAYSVEIEDNGSYDTTEQKNNLINETINTVIDMVEKNDDSTVNDFGIVVNDEGEYEFLYAEGTRRQRFLADVYGKTKISDLKPEQAASTPQTVIDYMCAGKRKDGSVGFGIDQEAYEKERVLQIVTVRYGMHLNSFKRFYTTTIASDVSAETVAVIKENMYNLQGVSIGEESLREYYYPEYFASIIGYTGKISQDEYDALSEEEKEKYALTDIVGKSGIEQVMDKYLQGEKGEITMYVNTVGKILETVSVTEPKAGNDVYLTLDKDLQITAYKLIEEKLAGIILRKLSPTLDYDRNSVSESSNVVVPIGDVYYSFIGNDILDIDAFAEEDATYTEKAVYSAFTSRQANAITNIINNLNSPSSAAYKNLSKEMQAYMYYFTSDLLTNKTGILIKDRINVYDEVYLAWKNEEINLYEYLNHAIAENWVDSTIVQDFIETEGNYSDSTELYQGILNYLEDYLKTDKDFEKLVYRYMIKDGSIKGSQLCILLYDQGILAPDETMYNRLISGYSAYDFMRQKIEKLEITPGMLGVEPSSGSYVMTEVKTGNTLVCVSYPGYDNNRLANSMDVAYYNQVYVNSSRPFYNKATQELTAPGSTFKPLSSIIGLSEGIITESTQFLCAGPFMKITPNPKCWISPRGHGSLNVVGGIQNSCNLFFYNVGFNLGLTSDGTYSSAQGIERIQKYAKMFGLGETSGLEISEMEPHISDEDAVRSAIGQGTHIYTTSQIARYMTAVANRGTVYDLTLLDKVLTKEGDLIVDMNANIINQVTEVSEHTYDLVTTGMENMVNSNARFDIVKAGGIQTAGKTGTAQQSKTHADHVLFAGFAPSREPEIAYCTRIANGYNSGYTAEIGRDMVLKYFGLADDSQLIYGTAGVLGTESHSD